MTFFGGDLTKAHFTFGPHYRFAGEETKAAQARRIAEYKTLRGLGWKERYFQFTTTDAKAKAKARKDCEKDAARWSIAAGFALDVNEGCFL